ncbi:MAG: hypothetical protein K9I35_03435 [Flavobacterium sp.]|nr:hypothetical protein [Flavobacterium sp.]
MFKKLLFTFFLFCLQNTWSQVNPLPVSNSYYYLTMTPSTSDESSVTVLGSQYIDQTFYSSTFTCISEITPPIRYNTFKEEMEFKVDGKLYYLDKNENCELTINNLTYKYFKNFDKKSNDGYLMVLTKSNDSKYILYKKEKVKYVPPYVPGSTYGEEKPAKYIVDKSKYYIKNQDSLTELPEKKSDFLKLFPNNKDSLELFLKENKIKFTEDSSVLLLVNYLNTL